MRYGDSLVTVFDLHAGHGGFVGGGGGSGGEEVLGLYS